MTLLLVGLALFIVGIAAIISSPGHALHAREVEGRRGGVEDELGRHPPGIGKKSWPGRGASSPVLMRRRGTA